MNTKPQPDPANVPEPTVSSPVAEHARDASHLVTARYPDALTAARAANCELMTQLNRGHDLSQ